MPMDPAVTGAIIGGGSSIIGDVANLFGTSKANKQSMQFQKDMYARQRADSLADWNMQNAYNSPAAQMGRFKSAGLNPNLIYGQQNTAQPVRSSSPGSFTAKPASFEGLGRAGSIAVGNFLQAKMQEAQQKNINADTENKTGVDRTLKDAQVVETLQRARTGASQETKNIIDAKSKEILTPVQKELYSSQINKNDQSVAAMQQDMEYQIKSFELDRKVKEFGIQKTVQEIKESIARIGKLHADTDVSKRQLDLMNQTMNEIVARTSNINSQTDINKVKKDIEESIRKLYEKGGRPGDFAPFRWLENWANGFKDSDGAAYPQSSKAGSRRIGAED